MKIISWNVNGLRAIERKGNLKEFIDTHQPDVWCIQETKSQPEQVAFLETDYAQYAQYYHSAEKAGYSGVSIWVKNDLKFESVPEFIAGMPDDPVADEGRVARLDFDLNGKKYSVLGVYFPNGGKSEQAWEDKLIFYEKFLDYVNELRAQGRTVIWSGDVNCAHNEIDLARPKDNDGKIGFHPRERAWIDKVQNDQWVDVWRKMYPEVRDVYSWWHLITRSRATNVGWRIDYCFVDHKDFSHVKKIEYLTDQMGSDHCPVVLEV